MYTYVYGHTYTPTYLHTNVPTYIHRYIYTYRFMIRVRCMMAVSMYTFVLYANIDLACIRIGLYVCIIQTTLGREGVLGAGALRT